MENLIATAGPGNAELQVDAVLFVVGWIVLHVISPFIAGVLYAVHWRTLLAWIALLAVGSFASYAGHELWGGLYPNDFRTVPGVLAQCAAFVFLPVFAAVAAGIFLRRLWDRFTNKDLMAELQE